MSTPPAQATGTGTSDMIARAVEAACGRVAPAWPLDRMIAVNPLWGFVDRPIEQAGREIAALAGRTMVMPGSWYLRQWDEGRCGDRHVQAALAALRPGATTNEVRHALGVPRPAPTPVPLVADLVDRRRDLTHHASWRQFIVQHVSQACAAQFDDGQASWRADQRAGLYPLWRTLASHDRSPRLMMGLRHFRRAAAALPAEPMALIREAVAALGLPQDRLADIFAANLLRIPGWASWCAFRRWEARLQGRDDDAIIHLLAVMLGWELSLFRLSGVPELGSDWNEVLQHPLVGSDDAWAEWVVQRALELAYREQVACALRTPAPAVSAPVAQAVFCIDVRSEVFRRALEASDPRIDTLGFAGFFGLPIAYDAGSGRPRPQLPGLLSPSLVVRDHGNDAASAVAARRRTADRGQWWTTLFGSPLSTFTAVESIGLGIAGGLLRDSLGSTPAFPDPLRAPPACGDASPRLDDRTLSLDRRVDLAAGILRGMSLRGGYARLLALIGHGSSTTNNPQAAGLACGACGGQTGEVNARVLAALLNDQAVRAGLAGRGLLLPPSTHVVAGLHDTTTDEITLFDLHLVPPTHASDVASLQSALASAGDRARAERAPDLGLPTGGAAQLRTALRRRAADWSEVRPEWGLARNAGFIAAPRGRTRLADLDGRTFLHEYRWEEDPEGEILEQIMTAPMVVAHWINMQYYASTVDPAYWGSGNKVLHNVGGGHLGLYEGAAGDLRIGLARQSVHDGRDWFHHPLRLTVFLEAPAEMVDRVLAAHPLVRNLVGHGWLHLCRIEADGRVVEHAVRHEEVPSRP